MRPFGKDGKGSSLDDIQQVVRKHWPPLGQYGSS